MSSPDSFESIPAVYPNQRGPIPDEEDIASDLVAMGRSIADGELRDAVTERYVDEANADVETDEALDDIARSESAEDLAEDLEPDSEGA